MKIFYKRSIWVMLTVYLILWLIVTLVAGNVLESYKKSHKYHARSYGFQDGDH